MDEHFCEKDEVWGHCALVGTKVSNCMEDCVKNQEPADERLIFFSLCCLSGIKYGDENRRNAHPVCIHLGFHDENKSGRRYLCGILTNTVGKDRYNWECHSGAVQDAAEII
jgi:hypothetical protein